MRPAARGARSRGRLARACGSVRLSCGGSGSRSRPRPASRATTATWCSAPRRSRSPAASPGAGSRARWPALPRRLGERWAALRRARHRAASTLPGAGAFVAIALFLARAADGSAEQHRQPAAHAPRARLPGAPARGPDRAVREAGGVPARCSRCGSVMTEGFQVPMVAGRSTCTRCASRPSRPSLRPVRPWPNVILQDARPVATPRCCRPRSRSSPGSTTAPATRLIAHVRTFRVFSTLRR